MDVTDILDKYASRKPKKAPRSERAEICDLTATLLNQDIKKVLGWTRHLQPDQIYRLYKESNNKPQLWWVLYREKYKQNNMEKLIIQKLTEFPQFRERKTRGPFLAKLAIRETGKEKEYQESKKLSLDDMAKFAITYATLERMWRDCLMKNVHLRGNDYDDKLTLENRVKSNLGY